VKLLTTTLAVAVALSFTPVSEARADECLEPTQAPSSAVPTVFTIIDTEVGTTAYERLVTYSNGGHTALGTAIAQAHGWFGVCEYVGVGIGNGSGGNGYRPNFTLALWRSGIDVALARSAVYQLIGASTTPVVTNGDCAVSCDGTIDGVAPTTTTVTPTTTTTVAVITTTTVAVTTTTQAPAPMNEPASEPVDEPTPVAYEAPTPTTTTTTTPLFASAVAGVESTVFTPSATTTRKPFVKKPVVKSKKPVVKSKKATVKK
jgi:hypothetical protein